MRFIRPILGCILIIAAFAGLMYWENEGRERFTMVEVAVAAKNIEVGEVISRDMFRAARVDKDNVLNGALNMSEVASVAGKIADRPIDKRSQVTKQFFDDPTSRLEKGTSIFVIKPSWIDMRSSSLRSGDTVKIYSDTADKYFGTYVIAFVKDDNEQEVVEAEGFASPENILDRKTSSRPANHIEIIATLSEYQAIQGFVQTEGRGLMIVQEGAV